MKVYLWNTISLEYVEQSEEIRNIILKNLGLEYAKYMTPLNYRENKFIENMELPNFGKEKIFGKLSYESEPYDSPFTRIKYKYFVIDPDYGAKFLIDNLYIIFQNIDSGTDPNFSILHLYNNNTFMYFSFLSGYKKIKEETFESAYKRILEQKIDKLSDSLKFRMKSRLKRIAGEFQEFILKEYIKQYGSEVPNSVFTLKYVCRLKVYELIVSSSSVFK